MNAGSFYIYTAHGPAAALLQYFLFCFATVSYWEDDKITYYTVLSK